MPLLAGGSEVRAHLLEAETTLARSWSHRRDAATAGDWSCYPRRRERGGEKYPAVSLLPTLQSPSSLLLAKPGRKGTDSGASRLQPGSASVLWDTTQAGKGENRSEGTQACAQGAFSGSPQEWFFVLPINCAILLVLVPAKTSSTPQYHPLSSCSGQKL